MEKWSESLWSDLSSLVMQTRSYLRLINHAKLKCVLCSFVMYSAASKFTVATTPGWLAVNPTSTAWRGGVGNVSIVIWGPTQVPFFAMSVREKTTCSECVWSWEGLLKVRTELRYVYYLEPNEKTSKTGWVAHMSHMPMRVFCVWQSECKLVNRSPLKYIHANTVCEYI